MKQPYNTTIYNTALYLRLSRDDELQGESGSIQTQRMMLRQYAAEHGLTVVDEYIDDGWSGTNFERPSFQRMIDDIEDGKINCVVTKDGCYQSLLEGGSASNRACVLPRVISQADLYA